MSIIYYHGGQGRGGYHGEGTHVELVASAASTARAAYAAHDAVEVLVTKVWVKGIEADGLVLAAVGVPASRPERFAGRRQADVQCDDGFQNDRNGSALRCSG